MSCHNIGHALNDVVLVILDKYSQGKINIETARELIQACYAAVGWCDGNYYEAVDCCRENRCGRCLQKLSPGNKLYDLGDAIMLADRNSLLKTYAPLQKAVYKRSRAFEIAESLAAYPNVCEKCLNDILDAITGSRDKSKELRTLVESTLPEIAWHVQADNGSDYYLAKYEAQKQKKESST